MPHGGQLVTQIDQVRKIYLFVVSAGVSYTAQSLLTKGFHWHNVIDLPINYKYVISMMPLECIDEVAQFGETMPRHKLKASRTRSVYTY